MRTKKTKSLELFLLMLNLSQISRRERIVEVFLGAMAEIWPGAVFSHRTARPDSAGVFSEIADSGSAFGFIEADGFAGSPDEDGELFQNAVAMLGVILKKNEQDSLLVDEKLHLEKLVKEKLRMIRESEERFRGLVEHASDMVYTLTPEGVVTYMSPNWLELMGEPASEALGKSFEAYVHPEDLGACHAFLERVLGGGERLASVDYRIRHRDGSIRWHSSRGSALRDRDGNASAYVGIARDITDLKRAEEAFREQNERFTADLERLVAERTAQLEATNLELDAFAYSVSHDLRAPLRAIGGFSRMLVEDFGAALGGEGARLCSVISDNAADMGKLIDDLLAFSRLGREAMAMSAVDMESLARSAFLEVTTEESRRRIDFDVGPLPPAMADPRLVRLVWTNLLANAVKFTAGRGRPAVDVGSESRDGETVYSVRDNGVGFDMERSGRLFGVFQRLHGENEFEGTGVGLAIVQRIVKRHGGRVWAESRVGDGATFRFSLGNGDGR